jgi:transcriptional regulator with XRE-family HTH domain
MATGVVMAKKKRARTKRKRFEELREQKKFTQQKLANAAGLALSVVVDLEAGRSTNPRFDTLRSIAQVLGVSVYEVIEALELPKKPRERKKPN